MMDLMTLTPFSDTPTTYGVVTNYEAAFVALLWLTAYICIVPDMHCIKYFYIFLHIYAQDNYLIILRKCCELELPVLFSVPLLTALFSSK